MNTDTAAGVERAANDGMHNDSYDPRDPRSEGFQRDASPKFQILPRDVPVVQLSKYLCSGSVVALNEEAARRLFEYVQDCGIDEGDEWLIALTKQLEATFVNGFQPRLGRQRIFQRRQF